MIIKRILDSLGIFSLIWVGVVVLCLTVMNANAGPRQGVKNIPEITLEVDPVVCLTTQELNKLLLKERLRIAAQLAAFVISECNTKGEVSVITPSGHKYIFSCFDQARGKEA